LCFLRTSTIYSSGLFLGCTTIWHSNHCISTCITRIGRFTDCIPYLCKECSFT
jgi:hypothetical protein